MKVQQSVRENRERRERNLVGNFAVVGENKKSGFRDGTALIGNTNHEIRKLSRITERNVNSNQYKETIRINTTRVFEKFFIFLQQIKDLILIWGFKREIPDAFIHKMILSPSNGFPCCSTP